MTAIGAMRRIEVVDVEKRWTATSGLHPVTFRVDAGEFVVVRGRSGSGKSTLLAVIAGWCPADAGSVRIDDRDVVAGNALPWARLAIVPQVLALADELSVRENVIDACPAGGVDRVEPMLAALDLLEVAHRPPSEVSMGQQQRTAVARALVAQASIVLADEPTSHQDARHVDRVISALVAAAAAGSAVVVASHEAAMVGAAGRIIDLVA